MPYILRIIHRGRMEEVDLSDKKFFSIGSSKKDNYQITDDEVKSRHMIFQRKGSVWYVKCKERVTLGKVPIRKKVIHTGDVFLLQMLHNIACLVYSKEFVERKRIDLSQAGSFTIGRDGENTIQFLNSRISGRHAEIYEKNGQYLLEDTNSTNGIFLNNQKIKKTVLKQGDIISIDIYDIFYNSEELIIDNVTNDLKIHLMEEKNRADTEYPYFKRSPRLKLDLPSGEIEVQSPPAIGSKPEINWSALLLPSLSMIGIIGGITFLTKGSNSFLFYTVPMSLMTVMVAFLNYKAQMKKHRRKESMRLEKYEKHIQSVLTDIENKTKEQWKAMNLLHPPLAECFDMVRNMDRRLWEKKPQDSDFMSVRIGSGLADFSVRLKIPKKNLSIDEDYLKTRPEEIYDTFSKVKNLPLVLELKKFSTCGLIGRRQDIICLAKNIIAEVTALHCYTDVKLVTVFTEKEKEDFAWVRWLPHSFDEERQRRYLACSEYEASLLLKELEEVLKQRKSELQEEKSFGRKNFKLPYFLFLISSPHLLERESIASYLLSNNPDLGVGTVMLFDDLAMLPKDCSLIVDVRHQSGLMYNKENIGDKQRFTFDNSSMMDFEAFSRSMAPIRTPEVSVNAMLPGAITFLEGYHVENPEDFDLQNQWERNLAYESMSVPLGIKTNGEVFYFDIHEKKHGPHGIIAGMTGSGKSEMVQSWILSMALKFSPKEVSFVLIDFKGTGLILPFMKLPHLAGTISDLDTNIRRNLISLENELSRRKALLDSMGVNNITAYSKLYKEGRATEPLSFLFLVIDEFAEFKVQFPDFMTVINRVFAIGRTLGVFALLLTQKPSGVVDDKMNANTRFRWCLKVASSADSKEMIRHSDAVKINHPGRAYVQVGEDEVFEIVQSYWSGAPYRPDKKERLGSLKISFVELSGKKTSYESPNTLSANKSIKSEIDVIVDYLDKYVRKNRIEKAKKIWMKKMPYFISLTEIIKDGFDGEGWRKNHQELAPLVGLVDDPLNQEQYPLKINFSRDGHTAVYGAPTSGKTSFIQSLITACCMMYKPNFVNIYVMDFGGWNLGVFKDFPHVGDVVNGNEEEKIKKLARMLTKELERRKKQFAEIGVGSMHSYREETGDTIPNLLLAVDNFAPVYHLYPDLEMFFINLTRESANYGIYLLTTCNTPMALGYKTGQNIKMSLALQMTDRSDYAQIVGKNNGLEPEKNAGRGLVKGKPPLEFQTALPADSENESKRGKLIREMARAMAEKWTGDFARAIPTMPERIAFKSIKTKDICIGLDTAEIEPLAISFRDSHYILVSGKPQSGKSNLLKVILQQFVNAQRVVFDISASAYQSISGRMESYISDPKVFDSYLEELVPVLQERSRIYKEDAKAIFEPILIVIDDLKSCFDAVSDKSVQRLNAIVNLGKGLNVNLLVAGNYEDIVKLYHRGEPFTISLVRSQISILLGATFRMHSVFKSDLHYSELDEQLNDYEGYLLIKEKASRFKAMYEK